MISLELPQWESSHVTTKKKNIFIEYQNLIEII